MRAFRDKYSKINGTTYNFHTSLLASAIYNSSSDTSRCFRAARPSPSNLWRSDTNIADRIQNCVTIAAAITSPSPKPKELMRSLSIAASMSTWARDYMYMPYYLSGGFDTYRESDALLEVALLVAYGYDKQDVLEALLSEAKKGLLKPYRTGWADEAQAMWFKYGSGLQIKPRGVPRSID
jgi:hypothetical protein